MCGDVAYEYSGEPAATALCHCTDCQKWSGGAYTSNVVVPRKDFKVVKGTPKHYNVKGDSGKMNDHWFCGGAFFFSFLAPLYPVFLSSFIIPQIWSLGPYVGCLVVVMVVVMARSLLISYADCGSSLYTELEVMPEMVCIKAGSIDDKSVRDFSKTSVEFYTKDRMAYQHAVEGAEQKPVFG